jgi:translation initiation factor 1A
MKDRGIGGKNRRKGKGSEAAGRREIVFSGDDSSYAFVTENLGNGHFRLSCEDGVQRLGVLRGSMRKRVWVRRADIVLATRRSFQDDKVDIVHKYQSDEVHYLNSLKQIPAQMMALYSSGEAAAEPEDDTDIVVFEEDINNI